MATSEQDAWVGRVLGVQTARAKAASGQHAPMLPTWIAAKEEVDAGIGELQRAIVATGDDDLLQIAEYGLYGVTAGQGVRLMAALRDADGSADAAARTGVVRAVQAYRDYLDGAPIVDLIESNPFGVQVPLRRRLGQALDELERLAAA